MAPIRWLAPLIFLALILSLTLPAPLAAMDHGLHTASPPGAGFAWVYDAENDVYRVVPKPADHGLSDDVQAPDAPREAPRSGPDSMLPGQWEGFAGVSWGCNGEIRAMAEGNDGLLYLGGFFSVCGDVAANNIVAYDPVTNQFAALGEGPTNGVTASVSAIEVVGDQVYVGGFFSVAGGLLARRVAIWDGAGWQPLGNNELFNSGVSALHWYDGALYAGGFFTQIGSGDDALVANRIAVWQDGSWSALGDGVNDVVRAISSWNGQVFLGGQFSEAGGEVVSRVAAWDGEAFLPLQGEFGEGVSFQGFTVVNDLAAGADGVFVGGQFNQAGGQEINNIAYWDGAEWFALGELGGPADNGTNSAVQSIDIQGDAIVVAGGFFSAAGTTARRVARWDGASWQSLGMDDENGISDGFAQAVLWTDAGVHVGGFMYRAGTTPINALARFDAVDGWQALGDGGYLGIGGQVSAILVDGDSVYVGGEFGLAGDVPARGLARWDGKAWHAVLPDQIPLSVRALALDENGDLIIGGSFFAFVTESISSIARWDGEELRRIAADSQGFTGGVTDLSITADEICAAGWFTQIATDDGNVGANRVACFDGNAWRALGEGLNGQVEGLAHFNGELYAGGFFTAAGGAPANRIARWDEASWHPLGTSPNDGVNSTVNSLAPFRSELIVGGGFSQIAGEPQIGIGAWDGTAWTSPPDEVNSTVLATSPAAQGLYASGFFTQSFGVNPTALNRIGLWNGTRWRSLGPVGGPDGGLSDRGNALAATADGVWVGGRFNRAGDQPTAGLAFFRIQDQVFRDRFSPP